jgi:hypothetical protein
MECTVAESTKSHQLNVAPTEVCFKQSALQAGKAHDSVCGEVCPPTFTTFHPSRLDPPQP